MGQNSIVIGLSQGDEGKGKVVDYLCGNGNNQIVVRFSGGNNAGHTVMRNGFKHIFQNFGSGTLQNVPTYWSKHCVFYPVGVCNEYNHLVEHGYKPRLYVDAMAMVVTPFDLAYNRAREKYITKHGSVGVGISETMRRNLTPNKLYVGDLLNDFVYQQKMLAIQKYYQGLAKDMSDEMFMYFQEVLFENDLITRFDKIVVYCLDIIDVVHEKSFFSKRKDTDFIFEGSQGIMLDMDFGLFPNVTYANTTSKNAMEIIERNELSTPDIFYVTRAYQTRHGFGPMSTENYPIELTNTEEEINTHNEWQHDFRTGILDIDLLNHAICCDRNFISRYSDINLVVTCMDQIDVNNWQAVEYGEKIVLSDVFELVKKLKINGENVYASFGPNSDQLKSMYLKQPITNFILANNGAKTVVG